MTATPIYAGLLGLLFLALSLNVIRTRRDKKISLGDGGDALLQRRMRAQGNFAEYVPIALILIALLEWSGVYPPVIHLLGLALLIARLMHGYALSSLTLRPVFRTGGVLITVIVIGLAAILNVLQVVGAARLTP
jgi:uncharacterized membrane protein YecN with MAPEG domain